MSCHHLDQDGFPARLTSLTHTCVLVACAAILLLGSQVRCNLCHRPHLLLGWQVFKAAADFWTEKNRMVTCAKYAFGAIGMVAAQACASQTLRRLCHWLYEYSRHLRV